MGEHAEIIVEILPYEKRHAVGLKEIAKLTGLKIHEVKKAIEELKNHYWIMYSTEKKCGYWIKNVQI